MLRAQRVLIRADASSVIGSGHVMRCLSLAMALRARGASITFAMRRDPGHLADRIEAFGFTVVTVAPVQPDEEADAVATAEVFTEAPDWIVVDHYGLGATWQKRMRSHGSRILVIDDLADRRHDCNILLDQNLVAGLDRRYYALTDASTLRLLGPDFAMLNAPYRVQRASMKRASGPVRRILVYYGAADTRLTTLSVEAFLSLEPADVRMDIVLERANAQREAVEALAAGRKDVVLHDQLPSLAGAMAASDLCIGASGTTSWERLCLGLFSIVVTLAPNQHLIAAELHRRGLVDWVGDIADIDAAKIANALSVSLEKGITAEHITAMMSVVDGLGVERVCDAMLAGAATDFVIRPVAVSDSDMVLGWANDPGTRLHAFNQHTIAREDHERWFARRVGNPDVAFFIAETPYGIPIGQVRFERRDDGDWVISYLLAPQFRGRGLGAPLLETAIERLAQDHPEAVTEGLVKTSNDVSARIFRALGFDEGTVPGDAETLVFRRRARP